MRTTSAVLHEHESSLRTKQWNQIQIIQVQVYKAMQIIIVYPQVPDDTHEDLSKDKQSKIFTDLALRNHD